jgi:glycerol-3-phosphate dehydrogenase
MNIFKKRRVQPTTVVVIGGGATGLGIARDAALRGFRVILVERGELGSGTSSRFHGILHSGARYAVNDPIVAAECYSENQVLRQIAPSAITDTGGLFVATNPAEAAHGDKVLRACQEAGIPTTELSVAEALQAEPELSRTITRAFSVPDGFVDGARLLELNRQAALQATIPATLLAHHAVTGFGRSSHAISSVTVTDTKNGETQHVACDYVINAGGVWAGQIASLADVPLQIVFDKGTMIVFRQQLCRAVLNRCRPESDGDLLVPSAAGSILGTTARVVSDPGDVLPTQEEVDLLLAEGAALVPAIRQAEATRIYAGVRPLAGSDTPHPGGTSRSISRSFHVLDHDIQGLDNFISVVGGKVTLYRLMAEHAVGLLCQKSGNNQRCTTAATRLD